MSYYRNNLIPALLWCGLSVTFLPWNFSAIGALMFLRYGIIAVCFVIREAPLQRGDRFRTWTSRIAALLPLGLCYTTSSGGSDRVGLVLVVFGTFLVCLACLDLGKSFGVAPAVRPYVCNGIYRWLPHPMYLGHFIGEAGIFLISPSFRNAALIVICWIFYFLRMQWESELIRAYSSVDLPPRIEPQVEIV